MLQYIKENKHVILAAVTLFVVSMSTIMFFAGSNGTSQIKDLHADVIDTTPTEGISVKSLQEEENFYRKLVNNQEDSVFVMNLDGTIKFSSWNVESSLGFKANELHQQVFFLLIHPDDLSTFLGAFGKVIQNKKEVPMVGPYRLKSKDGEYHMNMGTFFPILTQGNIDGVAVSSKDISEKVKNQDQQSRGEDQNGKDKGKKKSPPAKGKRIMNDKNNGEGKFLADKTPNFHGLSLDRDGGGF